MLLPKSWKNLSLRHLVEYNEIDGSDHKSLIQYQQDRVSVLLDIESNDIFWNDIDLKGLAALVKKLDWADTPPRNDVRTNITGLKFKGFASLTLGEFIDCDHYYAENRSDSIAHIAAIMYRKYSKDSWGNDVIEPRSYNHHERVEKILSLTASDIYPVLPSWESYRAQIINSYPSIFEPPIEEGDEVPEEEVISVPTRGWMEVLLDVHEGDMMRVREAFELPLVYFLNSLSYIISQRKNKVS